MLGAIPTVWDIVTGSAKSGLADDQLLTKNRAQNNYRMPMLFDRGGSSAIHDSGKCNIH